MSFKVSLRVNDTTTNDTNTIQDEWVEIIKPNSKTKIYANLRSGICSKDPPDGVNVLTTNDFSDHWWELYDRKTGKYYYYNPEQQKTVWTKPTANGNGDFKRLLIIPVSKLQTFKRLSTNEHQSEKCDASTQTIASNLISTGTQTISSSVLEVMLDEKLSLADTSSELFNSSSCTHTTNNSDSYPPKLIKNRRQLSDFAGRHLNPYLKNYEKQSNFGNEHRKHPAQNQLDHHISSQYVPVNQQTITDLDAYSRQDQPDVDSYFGPASAYHENRRSMQIHAPANNYAGSRRDDHKSTTSTFRTIATSKESAADSSCAQQKIHTNDKRSVVSRSPQQMVSNNLSHYLVREARAMGIALISDDEIDDDDQESDDECNLDDDEDTDLRDDLSSHHELMNGLDASQDLGEDSSEGWKSLSDQDSPNGMLCNDQGNPVAGMSQQLDNRKLVENFKKSRQTSALGFNDSLGRSYKLDANHAVQKIKTVADSYFNHGTSDKSNDKYLRQLSTLSTLPRQSREPKDKVASTKLESQMRGEIIDADYDVVEENCVYYSDSERFQESLNMSRDPKTTPSESKQPESSSPVGHFDRNKSTRGSTFSVESFARENLTRHPKGGLLFNRKVKWTRMISWTKNSIRQSMISSVSSELCADSIASFKLIQQFMGDRKVTIGKRYRQILAQAGVNEESYSHRKSLGRSSSVNVSNNSSASNVAGNSSNQIPDRLRDELAYELTAKGCLKSPLRDEIFVQLARQLTENPSQESISWGLILMSILLSYFSPSSKFAPFLLSFLETHSHSMARDVCLPRLEKRLRQNWLSYCRKPSDGKEISIVRLSITKWPQYCGVFGESLERIMSLQACSPYLKSLRLPWILTTLSEKLIETGGCETEGIFRCAADHDLLAQLRLEIDCVDFRKITDAKQLKSLLLNVQDPHVIAGLLKLFFRQLREPVFPSRIYDVCLLSCQDSQVASRLFNESLSNLSKDVVAYLVRLLQHLSQSDIVAHTKMDTSNLSMVWAPNLLRAPDLEQPMIGCGDSRNGSKWSITNGDEQTSNAMATTTPSQSMIFEQTRQEMQFIKALITHLDTSFIKDVL